MPEPIEYQLIGLTDGGNAGGLLLGIDQNQERIRLRALIWECLREIMTTDFSIYIPMQGNGRTRVDATALTLPDPLGTRKTHACIKLLGPQTVLPATDS